MKPKIRMLDTIDVSIKDDQGKTKENHIKNKISDGIKFEKHDSIHDHHH